MPVESHHRLDSKRNLVLIGYRATGKSAVGARLAQILNRPLVDLDEVLVREAGQTIVDLVAAHGWEEFRRREKELAARYGRSRGQVLATGGGVVQDWENVQALRKNGVIIWLMADPATIQARLAQVQGKDASRPSLTGSGTIEEVTAVLKSRQPLYLAAAQIVVDTTNAPIPQVVEMILEKLKAWEEPPLGR